MYQPVTQANVPDNMDTCLIQLSIYQTDIAGFHDDYC